MAEVGYVSAEEFNRAKQAPIFKKVADIQESVAIETDIDKGRLHAGKHAGHSAFVYGTCEGVFVLALEIDLC